MTCFAGRKDALGDLQCLVRRNAGRLIKQQDATNSAFDTAGLRNLGIQCTAELIYKEILNVTHHELIIIGLFRTFQRDCFIYQLR